MPRGRAQSAYDAARAELAKLPPARTTGELEAAQAAAQLNPRTKGCVGDGRSARVTCPKLEAELARGRQRDRLQAAVDRAAAALDAGPPKAANTDAHALSRYFTAIGLPMAADRINDLLTILAVVMVEAGGGRAQSGGGDGVVGAGGTARRTTSRAA
jgi:hypothetical protein